MIFDHYWKKRAMKAERELRRARGDAACEKALREDQKDRVAQMSERDGYQAIAIETLQEENRKLQQQHERDLDRQEAQAKEIERQQETIEALRSTVSLLQGYNSKLWGLIPSESVPGARRYGETTQPASLTVPLTAEPRWEAGT